MQRAGVTGECAACGKVAKLQQYHVPGRFCGPCVEYMDNELFVYKDPLGEEEDNK